VSGALSSKMEDSSKEGNLGSARKSCVLAKIPKASKVPMSPFSSTVGT